MLYLGIVNTDSLLYLIRKKLNFQEDFHQVVRVIDRQIFIDPLELQPKELPYPELFLHANQSNTTQDDPYFQEVNQIKRKPILFFNKEESEDIYFKVSEQHIPVFSFEQIFHQPDESRQKIELIDRYVQISKFPCKCKKSLCLKMYCECFTNGNICSDSCSCSDCKNKIEFMEERQKAVVEALNRNSTAFTVSDQNVQPGRFQQLKPCTCKKSKCKKKYCECFSSGKKCSSTCLCFDCLNIEIQPQALKKKIKSKK